MLSARTAASTLAAASAPNLSGTESQRMTRAAPRPAAISPAPAAFDVNTAIFPLNSVGSSATVSRQRPAYTVGTLFRSARAPSALPADGTIGTQSRFTASGAPPAVRRDDDSSK